jgi:hypothetical protein
MKHQLQISKTYRSHNLRQASRKRKKAHHRGGLLFKLI